ncbi:MAG: ORF6N domain-containing protein [Elusimicrobia bacterium]|nr:ORF6N domain-containing protein [Elusimicrobiota bacterium]
MGLPVGPEGIERRILLIRGFRVMLDADLAAIYGVTTKRLNEQVRRNRLRFPPDFMFQLAGREAAQMRSHSATASKRNIRYRPRAFTEHGAIMLASILNSAVAIRASVEVVRAFVRLREIMITHKDLARRLGDLEQRCDAQFKTVFDVIRGLMDPPREPPRRIGFRPD